MNNNQPLEILNETEKGYEALIAKNVTKSQIKASKYIDGIVSFGMLLGGSLYCLSHMFSMSDMTFGGLIKSISCGAACGSLICAGIYIYQKHQGKHVITEDLRQTPCSKSDYPSLN